MSSSNAFSRLARNGAVRFGTVVLGAMVAVALAAPWLGTVDPSTMDASHIYAESGRVAPFAMPDGSSVNHTLRMGGDSLGRDIWSRVVYGTRVSLIVGLATACVALLLGGLLGMLAGYFRGVDAVLIGQALMSSPDVEEAGRAFTRLDED